MDKQDRLSNRLSNNSRSSTSIKSEFTKAFEDAFGVGPCWTESCPGFKDCIRCNCASTSRVATEDSYTDTMYRSSTSSQPSTPNQITAISPKLIPLILRSSPSSQNRPRSSRHNAYYRSNTSLNLLNVPESTAKYKPQGFRSASVTPTNLSPLPQCPASIAIFEFAEHSTHPSVDDNALVQRSEASCSIGVQTEPQSPLHLKNTPALPDHDIVRVVLDLPTPVPSPSPPLVSCSDEPEDVNEFVRPRIAALQPRCTCINDIPIVGVDAKEVPWVHTAYCRIIQDLFEETTSFCEVEEYEYRPQAMEATAATARLPEQRPRERMTARTCLRVQAQPDMNLIRNMHSMSNFFQQFAGCRGIQLVPNQDYVFVAYATDEQTYRAMSSSDGLLISQLNRMQITAVDMDEAVREIHGLRRSSTDSSSSLVCCNYLF